MGTGTENPILEGFIEILGKLSSYGAALKDAEKASKLLQTLPDSFAPLGMVAKVNDISLERII